MLIEEGGRRWRWQNHAGKIMRKANPNLIWISFEWEGRRKVNWGCNKQPKSGSEAQLGRFRKAFVLKKKAPASRLNKLSLTRTSPGSRRKSTRLAGLKVAK